jgi:outer membrane protein TolC
LQGGYTRNAPSADPFFTDPTKQNGLFVGVNINWNLFGGFSTVASMDAARVQVRLAQAQQKQSLAELDGEIRRTLRTLETQLRISGVAEKNRVLSEKQLAVEVERFNAGASSNIDVRNAQVKLTQSQLTQLQGRVDVEIARAALQRVAGSAPEGS